MEYVRFGSLSQFVNKQYKTLGTEQRLQLFKKFALDIAEVTCLLLDKPTLTSRLHHNIEHNMRPTQFNSRKSNLIPSGASQAT